MTLALALCAAGWGQDAAREGREIYNRACTSCHGKDGEAGDRAPALAARRRYLRTSEQDLFDSIKHGIPGTLMPSTSLPDGDVRKIVAYIRSLRATALDAPEDGNVNRGREIFQTKGRCTECHMLNGRGGILGPDLSNIAAERSTVFLREALTKPKPHPPAGFQPVRIVTVDGARIRGLVKNEHNFSMQVLGEDGKLHLLAREEIREVEYEKASLMPSDFGQTLKADEFQDLMAFLSRQGTRVETDARQPGGRRGR